MSSKVYTESEIAAKIAEFGAQSESVAQESNARRTRINEPRIELAPGTYRVQVGENALTMKAPSAGLALLGAIDALIGAGVEHVNADVFLWHYAVTDCKGRTVTGSDPALRLALQDARIAKSLAAWMGRNDS